jgi:acetyl esterase/lipase
MSWQSRLAAAAVALVIRRRQWGRSPEALARRARRLFGVPRPYAALAGIGLRLERQTAGDAEGEWLIPRDAGGAPILYLHGGGFVACSASTHRPITAALARLTGRPVFALNYRLAPEARLPAAHDDAVAAYEWLLQRGDSADRIVVAGDSAGGNLALSVGIQARDRHLRAPQAIVAFSPWTDLAGRGLSVHENDGRCAMFRPNTIREFAAASLGAGVLPDDPAISPAYATLSGLPPVLIHVGADELLLDDARSVADAIVTSGGVCRLEIYDEVSHCWQMLVPFLPEARRSLEGAAAFIRETAIENRL